MKLASIIHHSSVHAPSSGFTYASLRNSPIYPFDANPRRVRVRFAPFHSPPPCSGNDLHLCVTEKDQFLKLNRVLIYAFEPSAGFDFGRRHSFAIVCSRKTEQGEQSSTSGKNFDL